MILIRAATPGDADGIARVHVEGWRTTYRGIVPDSYLDSLDVIQRSARWLDILNSPSRVLVAEEAGSIVGFANGGAIRETVCDCDAELYAIYLDAGRRREGIGTALLADLARLLDEDGFQSMAVRVLDANMATRFYERSGAVRVGAKSIQIGGAPFPATAFAWRSIRDLTQHPGFR
jgi:GNAT superfamily N-acetyltransferase